MRYVYPLDLLLAWFPSHTFADLRNETDYWNYKEPQLDYYLA